MKSVAICVISILLCASMAVAQLPIGVILGQVKDSSGAAVPGAKITARNTETNQSRTAVTNDEGTYRMDSMPVGSYQITTEKEGFRSVVQSGLILTVGQEASMNFSLEIGATSQTVEVTAEAPLVSTTTSSLGGLVDDKKIVDLPLNGRNYNDLTLLQPGITQSTTSGSGSIGWSGTQFSSNGAPIRSNNYMLDGAIMTNLIGTSGASAIGTTLGVDGILEYRVITSSFSAEYGMTMGSQMTLVSKSGTNQFHGDIFEFLRNSVLDARNLFDLPIPKLGRRNPEFRRNNFGAAAGGPIKKDKMFIFGVYEGLRQSLGQTLTQVTLNSNCQGTASQAIWNGAGTQPAGSVGNCPQLGGATASTTTIAAVMVPFMQLYPAPNIPGTNNYGFVYVQPTREDYGQVRLDWSISGQDSMFGRYTVDDSNQPTVGAFAQSETVLSSRDQFATLAENHMFSNALLNSARFSFSETPIVQSNPALDPRLLDSQHEYVPGLEMGPTSVSTLNSIGSALDPRQFRQNLFTFSDDLDYTRGNHSLKFGFIINHFQDYIQTHGVDKGQPAFAGVSQFMQAQLSNISIVLPPDIVDRTYHFNTFGFYAQDSWKIKPRLTLNVGLRYEPITTFREIYGISSSVRNYATDTGTTFGPPFKNPSLRNFSPRVGFAWDVFGDGKTALRGGFGLLYDVNTYGSELMNTAGYNSPYDTVFVTPTGNGGLLTVPYVIPPADPIYPSYRGIAYFIQQSKLLQYNLAIERQLPGMMALTVAYAGSHGIHLLQLREGNPDLPNGVPGGGVCNPAPVGTVINYASQFDGSATSCYLLNPGAGNVPYARINPNFQSIVFDPTSGNSFYNALQVGLNKRLSHGLQFQSSYTYQRLLDNTQGGAGQDSSTPVLNQLNTDTSRAPADFDATHNWRLNATYNLPNLRSSSAVLTKFTNGWRMSAIYSLQTGYPFSVTTASTRSNDGYEVGFGGASYDKPDLAPGETSYNITHGTSAGCNGVPAGTPLHTIAHFYDPCAFTLQPLGFLGTLPRNYLWGPGLNNLDFSVVKDTAVHWLGEAGSVEFRAEFFNILNHANWGQPNATVGSSCGAAVGSGGCSYITGSTGAATTSSASGQITSLRTTSRQIQFGLKILF